MQTDICGKMWAVKVKNEWKIILMYSNKVFILSYFPCLELGAHQQTGQITLTHWTPHFV